ncbi:hypothetical protein NIES2098_58310 [Calothrix sp. NIES-2098]|nr:hypothetical protein NIES2098_58310 [Calothrix sp. NIES-2098]
MQYSRLLSILHYIWGGFWSFNILSFLSAFIFSSDRFWDTFRSSLCTQEPFIGDSCDRWIIIVSIGTLIMFATLAITNKYNICDKLLAITG